MDFTALFIGRVCAILLLLGFKVSKAATFQTLGPEGPVVATVGGDALLTCHLSPGLSAQAMEIRWYRKHSDFIVLLYRKGTEHEDQQMLEYHGRTQLLTHAIVNGSVTLGIHPVRVTDEGEYRCYFESDTYHDEAALELMVKGSPSDPLVLLQGYQKGGILVTCKSSGWYPEPQMLWRKDGGKDLQPTSGQVKRDLNGLFEVQSTLILTADTNGKHTCVVQNTTTNQRRQTSLYVADSFFSMVSSAVITLLILLALFVVIMIPAIYFFHKQHQEKGILAEELDYWRARSYAVDVTLDPDTASPYLVLTEDQKSVNCVEMRQPYPDLIQRFDTRLCILGAEGFNSGQAYWEVEVGHEAYLTLGAAAQSVERKSAVRLSSEAGIWALQLHKGQYRALTSPEVCLPLRAKSEKIGVFLDYQRGQLTFYSVDNLTKMHTFHKRFSETVFPFFWICDTQTSFRLCPKPL
ncbi:butyrophilin subfamily 2 member A1-like isoform X2 [Lissotriton helveticus]